MISRRQRKYRDLGWICCLALAGNVGSTAVGYFTADEGLNVPGVTFAVIMILGASFCFWKGYRPE